MNSSTIRQQFVEHLPVIFRRFLLVRHKRTQFYSRVFGEVDVEIIYLKSVLESLFHAVLIVDCKRHAILFAETERASDYIVLSRCLSLTEACDGVERVLAVAGDVG